MSCVLNVLTNIGPITHPPSNHSCGYDPGIILTSKNTCAQRRSKSQAKIPYEAAIEEFAASAKGRLQRKNLLTSDDNIRLHQSRQSTKPPVSTKDAIILTNSTRIADKQGEWLSRSRTLFSLHPQCWSSSCRLYYLRRDPP